ncbi:MAG: MgtC/SapB family protein, partial [Sphingomonas sp.]|nr:MgtC/SapB family protein [Sphingomonas sp.]
MLLPSLWEALSHIVSLALAYALALPVGWDREK